MPRRPKGNQKGGPPKRDGLPGRDEIIEFIKTSPTKVGKREIARAFGVRGPQRVDFNRLLASMTEDGMLSGDRKSLRKKGGLPPVTILEVTGRDDDGDLIAKPAVWEEEGERPEVLIAPRKARGPEVDIEASIGVGDRVLARISEIDDPSAGYRFEAFPIKRLPREKRRLIGIFRAHRNGGGSIEPVDRKQLRSWSIAKGDEGPGKDGDLVRFDLAKKGRFNVPQARVLESIGNPDDQRQISLIAVHSHGIPDDFPESVISRERGADRADAVRAHRSARRAAGHHRSARRARPRRRRLRRAGHGPRQPRRLGRARRYRRRGALRPRRLQARPRGANARQLGVLPRPRRADAAGAHLQQPVLAARRREPRLPRRAHDLRQGRQQAQPRLHARHDALGRQAQLPGGAGRHRRSAIRQGRPAARARAETVVGRLCGGDRGARQAPAARPRPARAQDPARRAGPRRQGGDARAPRRPPADRRVHDPGERRRGRDAGAEAHAGRLPHPRPALEGEAVEPARFPRHARHEAAAGVDPEAGALQRHPRARQDAARRRPRQRGGAAQPEPGRVQHRKHRPLRFEPAPATHTSPRPSAAMPTCSCIARW